MYDVAVVGAGPAGAMVAGRLAQGGMSVVLLEKHSLPRHKVCGGGMVYRARVLLTEGVTDVIRSECHTAMLAVDGMIFCTSRERPIVSMVMRSEFDQWLCAQACASGVRLWQGFDVNDAVFFDDHVCLKSDAREVRARMVVAADGAGSTVARLAGWPVHGWLAAAVECELNVSMEDYERFSDTARFDFDLPLKGYGWVFPKGDHLGVGLGVFGGRGRGHRLKQTLADYLRFLGLGGPDVDVHGYVIPLRPRREGFVRQRVFLLGDAAGLADPVSAEGISAAMFSADILAKALLQGGLDVQRSRECYERGLATDLLPELRAAHRLAQFFYASRSARGWLLRREGARVCEAVTDIFMGESRYQDYMAAFRRRLSGLHSGR